MLCSYGCGKEAIKQFKNGMYCCSEFSSQCPEIRKKNSKGGKGKKKPGTSTRLKGRTKENDEGKRRGAKKQSEYMKNGGALYSQSFITREDRRKQAEKISGPNHPLWNPNREQRFAPYTEEFEINKPKVRKRDNYICQLCFKSGRTVHHIDENKQDSSIENMVNLCGRCHRTIHVKDKGMWIIFYQPYFRCIVNEDKNRILPKEQVKDIQSLVKKENVL